MVAMQHKSESARLAESDARTRNWKRWGPYLSERAWGTVREDYSADGSAWTYFPHDHARSRAYRWNEDGLGGICDKHQNICFALSLWNGRDPILKERLFGLTGPEGNHGEDVKEVYYYLDATPTYSYMKFLYKYPQAKFPYSQLVDENARRTKLEGEFELIDTGVFEEDRYFDVLVEYAKAHVDDIAIRITVSNRGPDAADINLLPTVWFRNTWTWSGTEPGKIIRRIDDNVLQIESADLDTIRLFCEGSPELLFTENETNSEQLYGSPNHTPYVKDAFDSYIVDGNSDAVNPSKTGTKAAANYRLNVPGGESVVIRLRLTDTGFQEEDAESDTQSTGARDIFAGFDQLFLQRIAEADEFYAGVAPDDLSEDGRSVQRQAFVGMLWSKQFYHYVVKEWLAGDPAMPPPPDSRWQGRNHKWIEMFNSDVISMPDKWEYPWYAAWDLAFHMIPLAVIDADDAKRQLILFLREWYMHPSGQIPAYEWALGDVNPPVHAWAALRVFQIDRKTRGKGDHQFLARIFQKLLINFTWWVNRKDAEGQNVFEGGFLGLDNIGVFDRSRPLPDGGRLAQSDGTSWMAMYCLNMLAIALELAAEDETYEDVASKFFEHFIYIANAMNTLGRDGISLWDEDDGFYYDVIDFQGRGSQTLKVRSMVGLIPLFAVSTIEPDVLDRLPDFKQRLYWFIENCPDLVSNVSCMRTPGSGERRLLAVAWRDRLERVLSVMLDENEFLSPYGLRALSQFHRENPFVLDVDGEENKVDYEPAESTSGIFGGNSNWRGPVWFPLNYLMIESLQKFHYYYGDDLKVECPTGSGCMMNLWDVSQELSRRLSRLFLRDSDGRRPVFGQNEKYQSDPNFRDMVWFHEYFHGDDGRGLGANHQTGWTGLVAKLLQQSGE
jgi:Glycosyl hydrolase family 63 C-terminal domain